MPKSKQTQDFLAARPCVGRSDVLNEDQTIISTNQIETTMLKSLQPKSKLKSSLVLSLVGFSLLIAIIADILAPPPPASHGRLSRVAPFLFASGHVVLTRDDQGQHLVLTGEDGGKKGGDGDQLVISGNNMGGGGGGGQSSNLIMQDAANREGDIVMSGRSMIIPGEDGHIVLADSRRNDDDGAGGFRPQQQQAPNPFMYWAPYMNSRMLYRMMPMFFG